MRNNFFSNSFFESGISSLTGPKLRRSIHPYLFIATIVSFAIAFTACSKDFDIKVKPNQPQLVVEAYINNEMKEYNYVVLSRSLDYFSPDFQSIAVGNATVTITEGERINNEYVWDLSKKVQLFEANLPQIPANFRQGVYFDPRIVTNPQEALIGIPGKSYLLEISEGGKQYSSITTLLQPVQIDSLTSGYGFVDEDDDNKRKVRLTNHYKDPDTLNNTQLYYWKFSENKHSFGWGAMRRSRSFGNDDVTNGQYIHLTHPNGFLVTDTVHYHMASVTRDVYTFWQSFSNARNNNGPFATPVTLKSNIVGTNVTGCFSGLSLSSKTIIMQ